MSQVNEHIFYDVLDGRDELEKLYDRDEERFRGAYFSDPLAASQSQLTSRLIFSSHSLEKSLSSDNFQIGHSFMVVRMLVDLLNIYKENQYDKKHLAYINTLSVIKAFYDRHCGTEYSKEIKLILGNWLPIIRSTRSIIGGADKILIKEKANNSKKNFKDLAEGRFAVRSYSKKPVDKSDIEDVIQIATKTPTACNRQSVRVHVIYNKNLISRVLEIQGGMEHYEIPPVLLFIAADDNSYIGANERNQGYIDGGLFSMSILYALEYKKLAGCPLHAMFETERDLMIRGLLDIPDNEKLITFIAIGHFRKINNVCRSFRYPINYIMSENSQIHDFRIKKVTPPQLGVPISALSRLRAKIKIRTRILSLLHQVKRVTRVRTRTKKLILSFWARFDRRKYRNFDGAILTLTGYFNYGNVLQRYALQKFLQKNGLNFVSYVDPYSAPRDIYRISSKTRLKTPLRAVKRFFNHQKPYWYIPRYGDIYPEARRMENIISFVNKNISIKQFDPRDNYKNYIVGSDQVWRDWWNNREILGYYFFNFLKGREVNRVAYAASFGKNKIDDVMDNDTIEYIRPYIGQFNNISVRENSGVKMAEKIWGLHDIEGVVDPTLLLDKAEYSKLINKSNIKHIKIQPIFTYVIDETYDTQNFIKKISDNKRQEITSIRAHGGAEDDMLPPVELWLKGFRDAELVITNSFHGMMLSVINNTDFIIIGRESGGLSRINDFLSEYGINGRFIKEAELADFNLAKLERINWQIVNTKLDESRKMSGDWLIRALTPSKK